MAKKEEAVKQAYENLSDTLEIVNDIELGKEVEEKAEEEEKTVDTEETKAEETEDKEPKEEEKKEEPKEEASKEEEKEEPVKEEKKEPIKIEVPVIPTPAVEEKAETPAAFDIPAAPVTPVAPVAPAIKFPETPIGVLNNDIPAVPVADEVPAGPSLFTQDLVSEQPTPVGNAPTNFNSEEEINTFFEGLIDASDKRHAEEVDGIKKAHTASLGTFREKQAIKTWRAKLMDYSQFEQPVPATGTYAQAEDPLRKIA